MYFYYFDQYRWYDRVSRETGYDFEIQAGDICEVRHLWYILCLGTHISRSEQYPKNINSKASARELIHRFPHVIRPLTLQYIHIFVRTWFTTYKKALPLRIPEPDRLLSLSTAQNLSISSTRKTSRSKKAILSKELFRDDELYTYIYTATWQLAHIRQTLVVFPDVWTMAQAIDIDQLKTHKDVLILHQPTVVAKSKAYRKIAQSKVHYVFATYSQVFWDRDALDQIVVMKWDRLYYKSQKDPRYHAVTVAHTMADIYSAQLQSTTMSTWKSGSIWRSVPSQESDTLS